MCMSNGRQGGKLSSAFVQHEPVDVSFDEPSRTRQEFADECDINVLMRKFEATGVVSHVNQRSPMYLDLSDGVMPLQEALDTVRSATEAFMSLPARARAEFDNDPVAFVEFAQNPDNYEKMLEWGLAERRPEPSVQKVEVINPVPEPSPPAG
ncbi:internal scaffolding protein [Apis mellifera associated microvirus 7]|nr:internal scaffolding protein [Apis mellifera associated microvirus 7]